MSLQQYREFWKLAPDYPMRGTTGKPHKSLQVAQGFNDAPVAAPRRTAGRLLCPALAISIAGLNLARRVLLVGQLQALSVKPARNGSGRSQPRHEN
jgi:hypothetical protein